MRVVALIQARMSSTRLPGKVLMPVLEKPLLAYTLDRMGLAREVDAVAVATSVNPADDAIAAYCKTRGTACWRGSEEDVLDRFAMATRSEKADAVVRVTADCPLIDPAVVDRVVRFYKEAGGRYVYVSNVLERTYPRGLDCEVFSAQALEQAAREASMDTEREHVTPFFYKNPKRFAIANVANIGKSVSSERWTVDTAEDFELIRRILEALAPSNPRFGFADVLALLDRRPEWRALNAHVQQKAT